MRRCVAISLLLLFVASALAPLLALEAVAKSTLLACCRRNGIHHCVMLVDSSTEPGAQVRAFQSPCSAFPRTHAQTLRPHIGSLAGRAPVLQLAAQPAPRLQAEIARRIAFSRTRQKRGPPVPLLS